jgi:hypothetical protein
VHTCTRLRRLCTRIQFEKSSSDFGRKPTSSTLFLLLFAVSEKKIVLMDPSVFALPLYLCAFFLRNLTLCCEKCWNKNNWVFEQEDLNWKLHFKLMSLKVKCLAWVEHIRILIDLLWKCHLAVWPNLTTNLVSCFQNWNLSRTNRW